WQHWAPRPGPKSSARAPPSARFFVIPFIRWDGPRYAARQETDEEGSALQQVGADASFERPAATACRAVRDGDDTTGQCPAADQPLALPHGGVALRACTASR